MTSFFHITLALGLCTACGDGDSPAEDVDRSDGGRSDADGSDAGPDASEAPFCNTQGSQFDARFEPLERACCEGLMVAEILSEESGIPETPGCFLVAAPSFKVCLACGNGICEFEENRCSCPEDCGPVVLPDAGTSVEAGTPPE